MPRLGMGMPVTASSERAAALVVDDNFWLNDVSNHITPDFTGTRKNLLLQSQTFKTTWTTNNAVIPNDLYEAPDNSLTAQAITASSAGASSVLLQQTVATTSGETYTYSLHAKKAANGFVSIQFGDGTTTRKAWFNLSTGAVSDTSNILTSSFDKMDDDWFRVSITFQANATTSSSFVRIFAASVAGSTATGASFQAGTELMYLWGAQLEEDSRTSAYMVTTNTAVTKTVPLVDFHDSWDFDVDGDGVKTNDITIEADPDAEGVWEVNTTDLVTNGDFSSSTGWNGSISVSGGQGTKTSSGLAYRVISGLQAGSEYIVVVDVATVGAANQVYLGGTSSSNLVAGVQTINIIAGSTNTFLGFNNGNTSTVINSISLVSNDIFPLDV